jgi:hypothetical protein
MIYLKETARGLDVPIQRFQEYLYGNIPEIWDIDIEAQYECFGRAYRNQKGSGYVPELYTGKGNYRDAYFDDRKSALSFFGVEDVQKYDSVMLSAKVYLVFCVNLQKLYPDVKHRADEEAHRDIINLSGKRFGEFTELVTGIDSVFKGYDTKQIKYRDMHPWHCFRLNYTVKYTDECMN